MDSEAEQVRLEFTAAVVVDAPRVARFVQELQGVPADAWCDVRNVWSSPRSDETTTTTVQLSCERRVADFLCSSFATRTRHVSQGELLLVRCRRVYLRSLPTAASKLRGNHAQQRTAPNAPEDSLSWEKSEEKSRRPGAQLPRATMVDLLDCLGDQIVDVLEAFQACAEPSANETPRLTVIGLAHALAKLSTPNWNVASNPISPLARAEAKSSKSARRQHKESKNEADAPMDRLAIQRLRHLLSQLIAHQSVALGALPETNDVPFMVYTDFIACYVAYMSSSSKTSSHLCSGSSDRGVLTLSLHELSALGAKTDTRFSAPTEIRLLPVTEMCDTLEPAMMDSPIARNSNAPKAAHRKSRRHTKSIETHPSDPAFSDMFLGVNAFASQDDGLTSQRSESEDRGSGAAGASGQRLRSRGSRSSGLGSSKKKSTPTGSAPSVTKREATQASGAAAANEDVFQRENIMLARQQLTSSASRVRPVKQQQGQQPKGLRTLRPGTHQVGTIPDQQIESIATDCEGLHSYNNNNNDDDIDEPIVEQPGGRAVGRAAPTGHHIRGRAEWETLYGVNLAGRLPTRSRRYLNYSAGSDGALDPASTDEFPPDGNEEGDSPLGGFRDRPPSRQCHAFPTHLLDPREFFSPTKHHDAAGGSISITPWHAEVDEREEDASTPHGPEEDSSGDVKHQTSGLCNQRPPSRYMVKPAQGSSSSSNASSSSPSEESQGRLPSRRGAAGSRNQAAAHHYHDPKTDGFLEVDESVPPPFRVEISTEASRAQYVPSQHRRADEERRHGLKSRRSSSFGSRSQLKALQQQQSLYAPLESNSPQAREIEASTRNRVVEPQWFQDPEPATTKRAPDVGPATHQRAATRASRGIVQPASSSDAGGDTSGGTSGHATQQWFRSLNNPFFVSPAAPTGAAAPSAFDDMDAETAIANTPLFPSEDDLMAMTQLTDLHLDDFMGDPFVYNSTSVGLGHVSASVVATSACATDNADTKAASTALNTSLGRDFLSLFAQH